MIRRLACVVAAALLACPIVPCFAQTPATAAPAAKMPDVQKIEYSEETLPNGLKVIYAPLHQAPVVQVRVLYHVGSKDERADRQGFAHMFEHMMFRGSAHVKPQEHMHLVDEVGGICNAFTSFDQTVYHDTVPAENLPMALYLEADRMASFKVSDEIYQTERKVVAEEWRMKNNKPYGNLFDDYLKTAFTTHNYKWTPIGNMQHLLAAPASELQDFFNTYYVPNNACLVVAGDFDTDKAKAMVHEYFDWIPKGGEVTRLSKQEPPQTEGRTVKVADQVPLPAVIVGYHLPPYKSDDTYAITVLTHVLGEGSSSRLHKLLVSNDKPSCLQASALAEQLEDGGFFGGFAVVTPGGNIDKVKQTIRDVIADVAANGITPEELARAKTAERIGAIHARETAEQLAGQLGDEQLFASDPNRVNTEMAKLDAVTAADVQSVASKYCKPEMATEMVLTPDPLGIASKKAEAKAAAELKGNAAVAPSTQPVQARDVHFPANYPQHPPMSDPKSVANFNHGVESTINGVKVIVMQDSRLPTVAWNLTMRQGSDSDPKGKEGLTGMMTGMMMHGAGSMTYQQLSDTMAAEGISIGVGEGGDTIHLNGSCTVDKIERGFALSRDVLLHPTFPDDEFTKLKDLTKNGLVSSLENAATAASMEMSTALYGDTPLGRPTLPSTVSAITLEDVKKAYSDLVRPENAVLVISGDVTVEQGQSLAKQLTDGWASQPLPKVEYTLPPPAEKRKIILVDRPSGKGATIRMGIRAYDIHDADDKFAGSLASTIMSAGIESRLMVYVRAEKGYVYGVGGYFTPNRHDGMFEAETETKLETTGDTIKAIYKVLDDMKAANVSDEELAEAKRRVTGLQVMRMQTIGQQAGMRVDGILNGYPVDYYDTYAEKIKAVTADQVKATMNKFVKDDAMTIVVVAPADAVKSQLESLGEVTVVPMPGKRDAAK